ncbi:MAG TPA: YqaA family protein [Aestuariivirgaceae bacterium]|nr:YqaA family protein [Aestuariivirgaceae bacterium]
MTDLAAYAGLFVSAFTSATLLPGSSEAALIALLALGRGDAGLLVIVATAGNVLGSCVNWVLGRFFSSFRDRRWFPVDEQSYERAAAWFRRYGVWSLLLSWLPVIGDPLTAVAGALRVDFLRFVLLVSLGKAARYGFILAAFNVWNG